MSDKLDEFNGLEASINGKKIKASGLLALIMILTAAPIGLTMYTNLKIVEAMGEQKKEFAEVIAKSTAELNAKHIEIKADAIILNGRVLGKQDDMIERLDENNFIHSLTNEQKKEFKLRMPASLCKKLERRNC